jgi:hypothetical protein
MQALTFWKTVTMDKTNLLEMLVNLLEEHKIDYCVIEGQAVNAYVDPLVSLDLDLAVARDQIDRLESLLTSQFQIKRYPHSINISKKGSDLRVQIQTDARYAQFVKRASRRQVLGLELSVAALDDILSGKIWAVQDPDRRSSKRQKDLANISRLIEAYPELRRKVPEEILTHLV